MQGWGSYFCKRAILSCWHTNRGPPNYCITIFLGLTQFVFNLRRQCISQTTCHRIAGCDLPTPEAVRYSLLLLYFPCSNKLAYYSAASHIIAIFLFYHWLILSLLASLRGAQVEVEKSTLAISYLYLNFGRRFFVIILVLECTTGTFPPVQNNSNK